MIKCLRPYKIRNEFEMAIDVFLHCLAVSFYTHIYPQHARNKYTNLEISLLNSFTGKYDALNLIVDLAFATIKSLTRKHPNSHIIVFIHVDLRQFREL